MSSSSEVAARRARWPWAIVAWFLAMVVLGMTLVAVNGEPVVGQVTYVVAFGLFAIVGSLILSRDPRNRIGILFLWSPFIISTGFTAGELTTWLIAHGESGPATQAAAIVSGLGWLLGLLPTLFLLPLLFPDGRVPSRRWRPFLWLVLAFLGVLAVTVLLGSKTMSGSVDSAVVPNPFYVAAVGHLVIPDAVIGIGFIVIFGASVASLLLRFRRSQGVERQQIKWVAYGLVVSLVTIGIGSFMNGSTPGNLLSGLGFLIFPITVGVGVLRFHLYDLDVVVRKTVVYGALVVFATAVYLALVVGLGAWLGHDNSALTMIAAVVVAVSFQPARARLTRVANHLVYGKRATPYEVLSEFSERLGGAYADDDLLPRMARVLSEGIGAERGDVWLAVGRELRDVASWPSDAERLPSVPLTNGAVPSLDGAQRVWPVESGGELLGALAVRKPSADPISPADEKLVDGLAGQAGLVMRNVRLTEELKGRLDDLTAAQRRIVTAQDEARRRLERNIHDGAQQQLVALTVKARLARTLASRDPEKATEMIGQIETETQDALENLRDLARGIYPPLLADKGLVAALAAQARKISVPTDVSADEGVGRYPQEVEAAAYFCALEALQNVAKYAGASCASVTIRQEAEVLTFDVTDDGTGFDPAAARSGTGVQGMADRLAAIGGSLELVSAPGAGTTVRGRISARPLVVA